MSEIKESVGYALAQLCKAHRYSVDAALRAHNLRAGQEMILLELWGNEGLAQSQLVEALCVEPPTVTKMLQRMEGEGLIERRPDPEDARVSRVFLAAQGRAIEQDVSAAWASVEERLVGGLSAEERALLRGLLIQARQNLG
jgi:DNA-binding MarR family transcriptional regulator